MKSSGLIRFLVFLICVVGIHTPDVQAEKTIKDQMGRDVIVPDHPLRVISLAPSITEIVCSIGQCSSLIAVTRFSDYPPMVHDLPKVGSYIRLDLERIVRLSPDLCIAVKDGNPKDTVDRIMALGIPVFVVNPVDLESVVRAVTDIGHVLNEDKRSSGLARDLRQRMAHVKAYTDSLTSKPRVFFQIGVSPIVTIGKNTFLHELLERSGGINVARDALGYPRYSVENVLHMNPDVIIITSMARGEVFTTVKKQWNSWPYLSAVKQDRVYIVDSDILDRPTPRLVDGLEMLTALLHPDFVPLENSRSGAP